MACRPSSCVLCDRLGQNQTAMTDWRALGHRLCFLLAWPVEQGLGFLISGVTGAALDLTKRGRVHACRARRQTSVGGTPVQWPAAGRTNRP
jgi:hypothetical protein